MSKTDRDMAAFYREWLVRRLPHLGFPTTPDETAVVANVTIELVPHADEDWPGIVWGADGRATSLVMSRELLVEYCEDAAANPYLEAN